MTPIQFLLLGLLTAIGALYAYSLRSKLLSRLIVLLIVSAGVVFVLFPDATTVIANKVGVGRGSDLILYVSLLAYPYVFLLLYVRTRMLERKLTDLTRAAAIQTAVYPVPSNAADGQP